MIAAVESEGTSGLLHNMSARPRTPVTCTVQPIRRTWVSFAIPQRLRLDGRRRAILDKFWSSYGFTGAALVHPAPANPSALGRVVACRDDDLACNVVLRTRGSLLLAEMCLIADTTGLAGKSLISSDHRLIELAGGGR